jgi:hypothetical protein
MNSANAAGFCGWNGAAYSAGPAPYAMGAPG